MKRPIAIILAVAALALGSPARAACVPNMVIAMMAGYPATYDCNGDVSTSEALLIDVTLVLGYGPAGLRRVHLVAEGWPDDPEPAQGSIVTMWTANHAEGNLRDGLTLEWDPPLQPCSCRNRFSGGEFCLGQVRVRGHDPEWLQEEVTATFQASGIVDDRGDDPGETMPTNFTFNGAGDCHQPYDPPFRWQEIRCFAPADGDTVQGDFALAFECERWDCYNLHAFPYEGAVSVAGQHLADFAGSGEGNHEVAVPVSGLPVGGWFTVTVDSPELGTHELDYFLDSTAAARATFGAVKARY